MWMAEAEEEAVVVVVAEGGEVVVEEEEVVVDVRVVEGGVLAVVEAVAPVVVEAAFRARAEEAEIGRPVVVVPGLLQEEGVGAVEVGILTGHPVVAVVGGGCLRDRKIARQEEIVVLWEATAVPQEVIADL